MEEPRFKKILFWVGTCHVLVLGVFLLSNRTYFSKQIEKVIWIDGNSLAQKEPTSPKPTSPKPTSSPSKGSGLVPVGSSRPYVPSKRDCAKYNRLIHDHFYSRWNQPVTLFSPQHELSCILEVRIAQDGSIANYQIVGGSGNEALDHSVLEASACVKQIDPLPVGFGAGGVYVVRVEFKFSS